MTRQPNSSTTSSIALEEAQTTAILICKLGMWMFGSMSSWMWMDELCSFRYVDVVYGCECDVVWIYDELCCVCECVLNFQLCGW
jgi:hypothetical protein